ncbi:aminomethyltransferase [Leptolyngbya sp. 'hensonii']|uniref:glycine cleavage T C-terminal barrel domain-containing protein n=1 Tax=Leptolyngbya sp. 'hensonii' TaxID=1922337 RepID=UPI00094FBD33|nr:glycine cleavage T C-terminal barrel domain-containing protein [Leptolyngbya sp. 'hensonii']OLP20380.1 aminomethyltransferase [Leptolyngbya sp. 'hensonii']
MRHRLPPIAGEWIDRNHLLSFTFEGQRVLGYQGDTITSALWANGQRVLGRSFKYHRPRGLLSFANQDINTLMQASQALNLRADVTELTAGLSLVAVNTDGGVRGDRRSILDAFSRFMPVGFYYKAFHDKSLFPFWERLIRQITGLGQVDFTTPRQRTPKRYDFCDVLVIGAGPSGLAAALAAADAGAEVVLVEENARLGGSGGYQRGADRKLADQTNAMVQAVNAHANIRLYTQTQAAGYYGDHWIPLVGPDYLTKMRARAVIVATGAWEQPAVFHNNDLPGVMLASAAQRLIYRYAVQPMQQAVVLTANQDGYRAALDLVAHGVTVAAIVDLRPDPPQCELVQAQRIPVLLGHCIDEARSNPLQEGVVEVVVCPLDGAGLPQRQSQQTIACDGVLMSVGWAPATSLLHQAGVKMEFNESLQQFVPEVLPPGIFACGRVNGVYDFEQKLLDGRRVGLEAVVELKFPHTASERVAGVRITQEAPSHPWPIVPHPAGKNFVDFDEDLQLKDFEHAIQEGFDNIELLKRYTTVGMGPSQGKHSNMMALRILARVTGKTPGEVGTTTARPFFHPVPLSHLAGRSFTPERRTALHDRHTALGAQFMPAGIWQRPEYYRRSGTSREDCIRQEVAAVRMGVGLIDVGTLGKLELWGPDGAEFLERIYTGRFATMKPGTTRYALMLDEAGVIIDDGVVARLGAEQFYFTTTTSGATQIYRELTRWNTIWQLDCGLVNSTGARVGVNLAGPRSRQVLAPLTDLDLSGAAFSYLAVRQGTVAGIPALLMRVGFVGEWGYEIHVPSEFGPALWDALMAAGAPDGIRPFGVEAQRRLRLEKGHLIVGQDTDGLTTPWEANLNWAVKLDKPFFIGQRSLQIVKSRSLRQQLVGFQMDRHFSGNPPQECHLVIEGNDIAGRVTSIAFSSALQRYIGLAYLKPELAQVGTRFRIRISDGSLVPATVSPTPFYDPENQRQKEEGAG